MKVLVGEFVTESNSNVPNMCELKDYDISFGDECIRKMKIRDVFDKNNIKLIPSIYANAGASGVIEKASFQYIENYLLKKIKNHIHEIDGIFLMLHGASEVQGIGSGDHHILKEIRRLVGEYMPVAVVCDPHGNLEKEYVEAIQILRSYRESPHIDADKTMHIVAQMLCDLLKNRRSMHAIYRKLPLILGGEQSVSEDEPVHSINTYLNTLEKDEKIMSASWHVGYLRHDCEVAGCGIVIVPSDDKHQKYANQKADELAAYVWSKRYDFHYTGLTMSLEESLKYAYAFKEKPFFITDSGDNVTSGATGWNTYLLENVLKTNTVNKKILFASICDPDTYNQLSKVEDSIIDIELGVGYDELSKPIRGKVKIVGNGELFGFMMHDPDSIFGQCVTANFVGTNIDVIIANTNWALCELQQFKKIGIDVKDYDIVVVKQGYIFPELKAIGAGNVMALTDGATPQDTASLKFKRIMRPMFPIDKI
ncbi:microcystin degradation protein MlrC [Breznakia sp. PF5-3]|uniref:M81 family metallopeptidase n=1 Tax=unclassified Breznakia TaxID=2623764 RepID=UPI0024070E72|nr:MULTISPECIES: M81 family metallopeptidase [unclassified Breznakia]MDF9824207.1 microcystin degradation protein MlrC [Breznakia sp. PM6-1]MDF9835005.1 microcystin degradation protein MlrC [Breznakia sp. PF5-3]MDF9837250.1 microcystin degradation protein MlrC [Breznakia sp. PFB2-8]MDF9859240.1 microcystin degradation protein MlrC [Breznakia sp. PH5-24]